MFQFVVKLTKIEITYINNIEIASQPFEFLIMLEYKISYRKIY